MISGVLVVGRMSLSGTPGFVSLDSGVCVLESHRFRRVSNGHWLTYVVIPASLVSLPGRRARAYLPPLASNTLLVPSRLAFLQRSASGTACLRLS